MHFNYDVHVSVFATQSYRGRKAEKAIVIAYAHLYIPPSPNELRFGVRIPGHAQLHTYNVHVRLPWALLSSVPDYLTLLIVACSHYCAVVYLSMMRFVGDF